MAISSESKGPLYPRRNPHSAFRPIKDEGGLVVLPDRSEVKVLNPIGSKIYSLLDGQHSQDEIVRTVMDEFEVSEEQARGDLQAFLAELSTAGMLAEPQEAS
ncbi:MAG TPA: PqqD family protein [Candidatus Polarisedimenticolaceae bacterium]|nr:PqqD family protein [Candidatus Polarisedimenticolaceae bacterium]